VIQDKRVTPDTEVIGDIRANRDIGVTEDKRATSETEARPHHAPPDSTAIQTPITEEWIACKTKQHQANVGERDGTINSNAISLINAGKWRSAELFFSRKITLRYAMGD
jgi:hypothetical protein